MDVNNKNNIPNGWTDGELNGRLENNSPNSWTDGELMISMKTTLQRMENQMVGTKITRPRAGQYKNNSPKGWEAQK